MSNPSSVATIDDPLMATDADWGLLYGYGLFETMRVTIGEPCRLHEHLLRLQHSAMALGIELPDRLDAIARRTRVFCRPFEDRVVRLTVTAGNPDVGLPPRLLLSERVVPYTAIDFEEGIVATVAPTRRQQRSTLLRHKTLNQLQNVLAWSDARRRGFRESLFFNDRGHLAEGSRSNVFLVDADGTVVTPAESCGLLPGITRRLICDLLRNAGHHVREALITPRDLRRCRECFLTNSVAGVLPVNRIDDWWTTPSAAGATTRLAAELYGAAVPGAILAKE